MVFMKFIASGGNHKRYYFVGKTDKDILEDTGGGTYFRGIQFGSYKKVSGVFVSCLGLEGFKEGTRFVGEGKKCYFIGKIG